MQKLNKKIKRANKKQVKMGSENSKQKQIPDNKSNSSHGSQSPRNNSNCIPPQLNFQQNLANVSVNQMINNYPINDYSPDIYGAPNKDWLIEDVVGQQVQKDRADISNDINKKYLNLNLSDLMALKMISMKDKMKLSEKEQDLAMKLSVNETKLDEIEKNLMD